jgi:hypothetical protein
MKVFIPFSEALIEKLGLSVGELVPFQLEYRCLRMNESGQFVEQPERREDAPAAEVRA